MAAKSVDAILAALADPNRRAVIELLNGEPRRPSELAEALGLTRPALSRHLRILRKSGLIAEEGVEEDARARVCRLRKEPFERLRGWLDEVESFWTVELTAFRDHVAARTRKR